MQDFDFEIKGTLTGGNNVKTLPGITLRIYWTTSSFNNIPDIGAEGLAFQAPRGYTGSVESCNIEMINGVVHSLRASCMFTEL